MIFVYGDSEMKVLNHLKNILIIISTIIGLSACTPEKEMDLSGINSICELATLKCYYHNVARTEKGAQGLFKFLGTGYKKAWTEYSGIVYFGIDVNKIKVQEIDDEHHVIRITIPDAEVLDIDIDETSMSDPITDTGLFTDISLGEETTALDEAQNNMAASAEAETAMLVQAKERVKNLIEGYVKNLGEVTSGTAYTVQWIDVE